jgi:hypothetical protein
MHAEASGAHNIFFFVFWLLFFVPFVSFVPLW